MDYRTTSVNDVEQQQPVDHSDIAAYTHYHATERMPEEKTSKLKMPTLAQLLATNFGERHYLLFPWLREQESCLLYADTGVGKSMFALSAALAVAGRGKFLGWEPRQRTSGEAWKVLYVDGEMHITDIQERAQMLLDAVPGIDRELVDQNLRFLARQHQEPDAVFPSITEPAGMAFVMERVQKGPLDLVVLDNFSTLGEVEDENAASSFNAIQQFLLQLKVQGVATILVHHANKTGEDFRGSSKLAATFETIIKLERLRDRGTHDTAEFRVRWDKVRAGGPKRTVRDVVARLITEEPRPEEGFGARGRTVWTFEDADLPLLDLLKDHLSAGNFRSQAEIADFFGKSPPMGREYINRGIRAGMFTEDQVSHWLAKGKWRRKEGQTEAPIKPDTSWRNESLDGTTSGGDDGEMPL
jgi:AAA domain